MQPVNRFIDSRLFTSWLLVLAVFATLRPITAPDFWWHLSRGREVVSGTFFPSQQLLEIETLHDADWLGGVPFYLLWVTCGLIPLGLVAPIASMTLGFKAAQSLLARVSPIASVFILALSIYAIRDGVQPVPQLFDLLFLALLFRSLRQKLARKQHLGRLFFIFAMWGNLSTQLLWGILLLLCTDWNEVSQLEEVHPDRQKRHQAKSPQVVRWSPFFFMGIACLTAFAGGCLTPRGLLTWRDSILSCAPRTFANLQLYGPLEWTGALQPSINSTSEAAFFALWIIWVVIRMTRLLRINETDSSSRSSNILLSVTSLVLPFLMAYLSRQHIPLAALWILLDLSRLPILQPAPGHPFKLSKYVTPTAAVCLLTVAGTDAVLGDCFNGSRIGYGVSHQLDPRLLDRHLIDLDEEEIGWSPDRRSTGLVCWLDGNVKMIDHPHRALLGGRIDQHSSLTFDILTAHRAAYRRDDGTWGGSVRQLSEWNVGLLLIPMEARDFHKVLVKSPWQLVDLDSPSVPYVSTENQRFSSIILEILQQQNFVEAGPWQPTLDIYAAPGWRIDFTQALGGPPAPDPAIRQSQLFRAIDIPLASLRALLPLRTASTNRFLLREFAACQLDLCYQEWQTLGAASSFRKEVVNHFHKRGFYNNHEWITALLQSDQRSSVNELVVENYLRGDLEQALESMKFETIEEHFTAAMLRLELGQSQLALDEINTIPPSETDPFLNAAVEFWRAQIKQFQ